MPLIDDDINKILFLVQKGDLYLDVCQLGDASTFKVSKHLKKNSESGAEVLFANVLLQKALKSNLTVALKIWLDWEDVDLENRHKLEYRLLYDDQKTQAMNYEAKVYQLVTSSFMDTGISNNFIPFVQLMQCSVFSVISSIEKAISLDSSLKKTYSRLLSILKKYKFVEHSLKINFLITGASPSLEPLDQYLDREKPSHRECQQIIVQVLYALYLMQGMKLVHNDLHLGNILLEKLSKPVQVTCGEFKFSTKLIPRLFDWDFAYCPRLGDNPKFLDRWAHYAHIGNNFRKNSDYFQFLCGMQNEGVDISNYVPVSMNFSWRSKTSVNKQKKTTKEQSKLLLKYMKMHHLDIFKGLNYINMPKKEFFDIFPKFNPEVDLRDKDLVAKFDLSDTIYFGTDFSTKIIFNTGYECYPYFDPSNKILYPLQSIFKHNSTLHIFKDL